MGGILTTFGILLSLSGLVLWGWIVFVRDITRNR
jgi:hypothetical protein